MSLIRSTALACATMLATCSICFAQAETVPQPGLSEFEIYRAARPHLLCAAAINQLTIDEENADQSFLTARAHFELLANHHLALAAHFHGHNISGASPNDLHMAMFTPYMTSSLYYSDEHELVREVGGAEISDALRTVDIAFCLRIAVRNPVVLASELVTDARFSETFKAFSPFEQHMRCAALTRHIQDITPTYYEALAPSGEEAQLSITHHRAWAQEMYISDHPSTSIQQARIALEPILAEHVDLYHQEITGRDLSGGFTPNSVLFHDSLTCPVLWDTAMAAETSNGQVEPFQLSYDDLLAMAAEDQHIQCHNFLGILRHYLTPEEVGDMSDPTSLRALEGIHSVEAFLHLSDTYPNEGSAILLDRSAELRDHYFNRFDHNLRNSGDFWDDALRAAEYAFCMDPVHAGDLDPASSGEVGP